MKSSPKNLNIKGQVVLKEKKIKKLSEQLKTTKGILNKLKDGKQLTNSEKLMDAINEQSLITTLKKAWIRL